LTFPDNPILFLPIKRILLLLFLKIDFLAVIHLNRITYIISFQMKNLRFEQSRYGTG